MRLSEKLDRGDRNLYMRHVENGEGVTEHVTDMGQNMCPDLNFTAVSPTHRHHS